MYLFSSYKSIILSNRLEIMCNKCGQKHCNCVFDDCQPHKKHDCGCKKCKNKVRVYDLDCYSDQ